MTDVEKNCYEEDTATETETGAVEDISEKNWQEEALKFQDLYLRSVAETENMRRRFQKEREEQMRFAAERVVKGLLPVLDNLELALSYVKADAPAEVRNLADGVDMTLKGFIDVMADNGVQPVMAVRGQEFDPNLHEALGRLKDTELPPGVISCQIQHGYTLHGRLLRPSKVMLTGTGCGGAE